MASQTKTFSIDIPSITLSQGDKIEFKFVQDYVSTSNYTASLSEGNLDIHSLSVSTGYSSINCPHFNSASLSASAATTGSEDDNIITFSKNLSNFYNKNYMFVPNPLTGSQNSLYDTYGDVDYKFTFKPYDIVLTYLSDNTYVESRILDVYKSGSYLQVKIDSSLSNLYRKDLISGSYQRFLILTRIPDETNAHIIYKKRPGPTSYGLSVPENIHPDVLANIDTITKEAKQKLIELGGIDGGVL